MFAADASVLNHALVPLRKRAVFLRLVNTKTRATDYAAGGFHVSVARGLAGGCGDPAKGFLDGGTREGVCALPLRRQDVQGAWAAAAALYLEAFQMSTTAPLEATRAKLAEANRAADAAYALEGVAPPLDPVVVATTPPTIRPAGEGPSPTRPGIFWPLFVTSLMTAAGVGATALAAR